jgi:hypothetical protein
MQPEIVVVGIDDERYKHYYLERRPLNRCLLAKDLELIYKKAPSLVAIDLDLSPMAEPQSEEERNLYEWGNTLRCQEELNTLIKKNQQTTTTILIRPLKTESSEINQWDKKLRQWIADISDPAEKVSSEKNYDQIDGSLAENVKSKIHIADPELPSEFGITLKFFDQFDTLANTAGRLWCKETDQNIFEAQCRSLEEKPKEPAGTDNLKLINFQAINSITEHSKGIIQNSEILIKNQVIDEGKIIFFGARFKHNNEDLFLTAKGKQYGVDLHAAAFLTLFNTVIDHESKMNNFLKFGIDIFMGLSFGLVISYFWKKYFDFRLHSSSVKRLLAPYWIIGLFGMVIVLILALFPLSLHFLDQWELWASPIPIAIGMLFESFVFGSVTQVLQRQHKINHKAENCNGFGRFIYQDFTYLYKEIKDEKISNPVLGIFLLALRRLIWFVIVVIAIYKCFFH